MRKWTLSTQQTCEQREASDWLKDLGETLKSQKEPQCQIRALSEFYLSSSLAPSSLFLCLRWSQTFTFVNTNCENNTCAHLNSFPLLHERKLVMNLAVFSVFYMPFIILLVWWWLAWIWLGGGWFLYVGQQSEHELCWVMSPVSPALHQSQEPPLHMSRLWAVFRSSEFINWWWGGPAENIGLCHLGGTNWPTASQLSRLELSKL